jgi:hypothetical protein
VTVEQAAARIRYWARLNYNPKDMTYHQFMSLANELDPKEGADTVPAEPVVFSGVST